MRLGIEMWSGKRWKNTRRCYRLRLRGTAYSTSMQKRTTRVEQSHSHLRFHAPMINCRSSQLTRSASFEKPLFTKSRFHRNVSLMLQMYAYTSTCTQAGATAIELFADMRMIN